MVAPVCCDPLTARLVESLGFKTAYLGGFALGAVTCLTEPLTNMVEMAEHARRIARRIRVPLIIDGDAGFGEPIHTMRAIQEFEWGGVAGTHIEDQWYPKRAHYHKGVEHIIPVDEMAMKIRAAVQARQDKDFLIIARTDAMRTHGYNDGVKRGNAYVEAGADMVMCSPIVSRRAAAPPRTSMRRWWPSRPSSARTDSWPVRGARRSTMWRCRRYGRRSRISSGLKSTTPSKRRPWNVAKRPESRSIGVESRRQHSTASCGDG